MQQVGACRGVGVSFHLELIKTGCWCLLSVGVGESWKLVFIVDVIFKTYIKKSYMV